MLTNFYFTLFTRWTGESFTAFHCNFVEGIIILHCSLHLCRQTPFNLERPRVFSPGAISSPFAEQGSSDYSLS